MIPFLEDMIEPWLRREYPRVDAWFITRGEPLKKNLKLIAVICLFIGCYRAWVFEHKNAETAMYGKDGKSEARAKYNACDKERAVKMALADTYSATLTTQQATMNSCMSTIGQLEKPEALKILPFLLRRTVKNASPDVSGYASDAKYVAQFLLLTNKTITPIRMIVTCDRGITSAGGAILGTASTSGGGSGKLSENSYLFVLTSPAWGPTAPLVMVVFSNDAQLGACSFNEQ
jgi:hypothetical protein